MKQLSSICIILFVSFGFFSCKDDDEGNVEGEVGVITGADPRFCMCCGGWFIDIRSSTYRFYELPEGTDIDLERSEFPVIVNVVWEADEDACLGDEIILLSVEKLAAQ